MSHALDNIPNNFPSGDQGAGGQHQDTLGFKEAGNAFRDQVYGAQQGFLDGATFAFGGRPGVAPPPETTTPTEVTKPQQVNHDAAAALGLINDNSPGYNTKELGTMISAENYAKAFASLSNNIYGSDRDNHSGMLSGKNNGSNFTELSFVGNQQLNTSSGRPLSFAH